MVDYVADDDASGGVSFEEFTDFSRGHLLLIYPGFWAQVGRLNRHCSLLSSIDTSVSFACRTSSEMDCLDGSTGPKGQIRGVSCTAGLFVPESVQHIERRS